MGKLITYGIIAIIVLAILFFGLKYPGKFVDLTGSAIGWGKEKTSDALDSTDIDEKVEEKASDVSETIIDKLKEKGIESFGDTIEVTIPNEEGVEETFTCVKHD